MTRDELEILLEEIAMGRTESTELEWKGVWWALSEQESQVVMPLSSPRGGAVRPGDWTARASALLEARPGARTGHRSRDRARRS
jgi:hypothetical protein